MARCRMCREKATVFIPHHRLPLCDEHLVSWFERYLQRTITKFKMFSSKAKILVAVSGGKDSLVLWQALVNLGYQTDGVFIDLGIDEFSLLSRRVSENFAENLGRRLHVISLPKELGFGLPALKKRTRKYCSLCGSIKRYFLNRATRTLGYDVLVTGHNLDDEASALLGNVINWSLKYLARKYPVLPENNGFVRKAKPLCRFTSFEIREYAKRQKIKYLTERCPLSPEATRLVYAEIMDRLEEQMPGTKIRFYMDYLRQLYPLLQEKVEDFLDRELVRCEVCGEPAVSSPCFVCRLKEEFRSQGI